MGEIFTIAQKLIYRINIDFNILDKKEQILDKKTIMRFFSFMI